jgi:hypothetical protein
MGYRGRIYFTEKQKSEIWDRWQRGESMSSIGRRFDRNSSSIYPVLAKTGGIRPAERRRSRLALTLAEREEVSRGLRARLSLACHRPPITADPVDDQPRGKPQWRAHFLSGGPVRSGGVGPRPASQALQASLSPYALPESIGQTSAQVVAAADRRLAEAHPSRRRDRPRVP